MNVTKDMLSGCLGNFKILIPVLSKKKKRIERIITFIYTFHVWCFPAETPPKSNVVETTECYHGRGEGYRGMVDMTHAGLTCQRWDSQHPHNHQFIPEAYPCKWVTRNTRHIYSFTSEQITGWVVLFSRDLRENYCRNPDGQESPWCFTTDPRVRTMSCTNIPLCNAQSRPVTGETQQHYLTLKSPISSSS